MILLMPLLLIESPPSSVDRATPSSIFYCKLSSAFSPGGLSTKTHPSAVAAEEHSSSARPEGRLIAHPPMLHEVESLVLAFRLIPAPTIPSWPRELFRVFLCR